MRVFCYRNLHKKCFSIKALEGPNKGRVVGYADEVKLYNVSFKVSEAGRQRVLRERRKNVHAGVVGHTMPVHDDDWIYKRRAVATYNPYRHDMFYDKEQYQYFGHIQEVDDYYPMAVITDEGIDCYEPLRNC